MDFIRYSGSKLREISFPLGGIGTGCVGLAGNGALKDWEIFNKPNKGSVNGYSHFAIKAEKGNNVIGCKVLNGDADPPYTGSFSLPNYDNYGFGISRYTMAGLPHFEKTVFKGSFPIARLEFKGDFPGVVRMMAFNPFIPLNDKDSSIPAAFFEFEVENNQEDEITYTICFSLNNPFHANNNYFEQGDAKGIMLQTEDFAKEDCGYGDMTIATDGESVSYQEYWYRGHFFDGIETYWRDLNKTGPLQNRRYELFEKHPNFEENIAKDTSTLASRISLKPNQSKKIRYVFSWNYPNRSNDWNPEKECECRCADKPVNAWKNYYAVLFQDSRESSLYGLKHFKRLFKQTKLFKDALFASTMPKESMDAVSANLGIIKSPTCMRLEDGSLYGFEGCHCNSGCCEGTCTHVWNYAYSIPFLFPKLERSMRDLDYKYNLRQNGGMPFRLQLPLGREKSTMRSCADGLLGGIVKMYREWKISGDTKWLQGHWEEIKRNFEYVWSPENADKWDLGKTGVLWGRQSNTLDSQLYGPNSWLTGFYLAALKAGAEMAEYLEERQDSELYMRMFEKGKEWVAGNLFNGSYFYQQINLADKSVLNDYENIEELYWNEEAGEIKYQMGEGCAIDQVIGQWHANLCGLGEVFEKDQVMKAVESIYEYNFIKDMRNFFNPCRVFCLNGEKGAIICSWPGNAYRPAVAVPYSGETFHGNEYQAAASMIQAGLVGKGNEMVKAIRDRYDGEKRNPWNEIECGNNYARSMASYSLLLSYSGFKYHVPKGMIGFDPVEKGNCSYFWSLGSGWGTFAKDGNVVEILVSYGDVTVKSLDLPFVKTKPTLFINHAELDDIHFENGTIQMSREIIVREKEKITVKW